MTKLESGRSMVEMLGVLAIIGVLSIGGIAGYTMAMNRNTANNITDAAAKLSVIAYARGQSGVNGTMDFNDAAMGNLPTGVTSMNANTQTGVVTAAITEDDVFDIINQSGALETGSTKAQAKFNFSNN